MSTPSPSGIDFTCPVPDAVSFAFPSVAGQKVFVLGLGGGCDIITAYAISGLLNEQAKEIIYANTKTTRSVGPTKPVTPHIVHVASEQPEPGRTASGLGRAAIDHGVPRRGESPWIVLLEDALAESELVGDIRSLGFDLLVGVDTGGDSIAHKKGRGRRGRDQRMLRILVQVGVPVLHVVVAPGSDGEESTEDLLSVFEREAAAGRYRGSFSLDSLLPVYRTLSVGLADRRTPKIILSAADGQLARTKDEKFVIVPRGKQPAVPPHWLTSAFVFAPEVTSPQSA
jgi:hypothetical protein